MYLDSYFLSFYMDIEIETSFLGNLLFYIALNKFVLTVDI